MMERVALSSASNASAIAREYVRVEYSISDEFSSRGVFECIAVSGPFFPILQQHKGHNQLWLEIRRSIHRAKRDEEAIEAWGNIV